MDKTSKTPRKSQRRNAVHTKEVMPHEPIPAPEVSARDQTLEQERPALDIVPRITAKRATLSPAVHHEEITRPVALGNLIAKPDTPLLEQFRKLRSLIVAHNLAQSLHSVLITSCLPGEGKTTVALNLSASMAKAIEGSAILIDADLRKKSLSSRLGLKNRLGLSDVLAGAVNSDEIMIDTDIDGLTIVPAGSNSSHPAELVESMKMKTLIQQLREKYDNAYIIIDSTPLLSTSEAQILSQMVDGVIVVILAEKTRRDLVKKELTAINSKKILGAVLNCAGFETSGYYRKYYKEYYVKEED